VGRGNGFKFIAYIILDFLCYNIKMVQRYSDLLEKSLDDSRLKTLHLLADYAWALHMPIYLVGGVVRDLFLDRPVVDFDLVIEGDGTKFAKHLAKAVGGDIVIHSAFGTATWQSADSPLSFDLITARSETYSQPGALPTVKPSTIDDDLRRRDFTINAMALRLDGENFGELHDPLDGQKDLDSKTIRVLHDKSFVDDPTRIFRAARYAARYGYGFELDSATQTLINAEALNVLASLSGERLRHEFDLIFEEEHSLAMIADLEVFGVLSAIHKDLQFSDYKPTLEFHQTEELSDLVIPDILSFQQTLAWTLWLIRLPISSIKSIGKKLAFPATLANSAVAASEIYVTPYPAGAKKSEITFYLEAFPTLSVYAARIVASDETIQNNLGSFLLEWRKVKPHTTGNDLIARGLEPGPKFKEILMRLRAAWLDSDVTSEVEETKLLEQLITSS